jgi:hypothetical protein
MGDSDQDAALSASQRAFRCRSATIAQLRWIVGACLCGHPRKSYAAMAGAAIWRTHRARHRDPSLSADYLPLERVDRRSQLDRRRCRAVLIWWDPHRQTFRDIGAGLTLRSAAALPAFDSLCRSPSALAAGRQRCLRRVRRDDRRRRKSGGVASCSRCNRRSARPEGVDRLLSRTRFYGCTRSASSPMLQARSRSSCRSTRGSPGRQPNSLHPLSALPALWLLFSLASPCCPRVGHWRRSTSPSR